MRKAVLWVWSLLVLAPALWADEDKPKPDKPPKPATAAEKEKAKAEEPKTPKEQYEALLKEFNNAQTEFRKAQTALIKEINEKAKTDEEKQKLFQKEFPKLREKMPKPGAYAGRMLKLAEENAKQPFATDALIFVATNTGGREANKALEILAQDHAESPRLAPILPNLVYSDRPATEKLLRAVLEKNPGKEAKGQACLTLASILKNRSDRPGGGPEADKAAKEAETLFERVTKEFADVKSFRGSIADQAKGELFEIRNLTIGKVAPEIEGKDGDGKEFKLTDYRGKVVVLDFWARW